jgi:hypothetical protein
MDDNGGPGFSVAVSDNSATAPGAVPEPGSLALLSVGGLLAFAWRRRQQTA